MKPHLICCVLILALLPSRPDALRIFKSREELLNLLGTDGIGEERLYMEFCHQSSPTGNCMLAIDDYTLTELTQCSSSEPEYEAWWQAEMETPSYITRVVINTVELPDVQMNNALAQFDIVASGFVCFSHSSSIIFTSKSFPCDALADQLRIISSRRFSVLSLCEVIPYGIPVTFQGMDTGEMEVAIANCYQSSVSEEKDCYYALDRHFETRPTEYNGKICATTDLEVQPFWVAYFPLPTLVKSVKIFQQTNLPDNHGLRHVDIQVSGMHCNSYRTENKTVLFEEKIFTCERFGSNLVIQETKYMGRFALCQVQVFGHEMAIQSDTVSHYIGCFKDDPEKPDLDLMIAYTWMTPSKCLRMCKRANKKFFGLQNGQVCMCGNKYGRYGEVGEDGYGNSTEASGPCSSPCKASSDHACGGPYENSVYEIIV